MATVELAFAEANPQNQLYATPATRKTPLYVIDQDQVVRFSGGKAAKVPVPTVSEERGIEALKQASSLSFFGDDQEAATIYRVRWGNRVGLVASHAELSWELR